MSRELATRLKRLEKQHRPKRSFPLIVFAIQADEAPGPIIGLASLRQRVERQNGEDWLTFTERARGALGGVRLATAVYAVPMLANTPSEAPAPAPAPDMPVDRFALAGIGKMDSNMLHWHPSNVGMIGSDTA